MTTVPTWWRRRPVRRREHAGDRHRRQAGRRRRAGTLTTQLRDLYWASHADPRYAAPVRYNEP
jgi:hypothetical protein